MGLTVQIETTSAACEDSREELPTLVRDIAERIRKGATSGVIVDSNGNSVGRWEISQG